MPVLTILAHGATCGVAPVRKNHTPSLRGEADGWSTGATRRNTAWLRSVDSDGLTGQGYACTLTVRHCPPSPSDWAKLRRSFIKRLERMGLKRLHWVTEWQRRRVPHLHIACWFDDDESTINTGVSSAIQSHWIEVMAGFRPSVRGQDVKTIYAFGGWAKYVSKHAARGANHYQRNASARPQNWKTSGRIWGHTGDWETIEPVRVQMTSKAFYRYRRMVRNWRKADARGKPSRIVQARRMLRNGKDTRRDEYGHPLPPHQPYYLCKLNRLRGVSEWIPERVSHAMLDHLMGEYGDEVEIEEVSIGNMLERLKNSGCQLTEPTD